MGVNIGDLFKEEKISFSDLSDNVIAIDAYNVLHQFLASIRQRDGTPLKNSSGEITSHLSGLFHRTANLVEARIKPVYAFDGKPHPLKAKTIEDRHKRKVIAEKEWKEALEAGDLEKAKSKAQQTSRLTDEMIQQSKQLLTALGIPYVQSPSEGESQASYMVKKGDAYAVGSQDYDCLLVGSPRLVRNLTSADKRKLPGKEVVELYLTAPAGRINKPEEELKGFAKTRSLNPGESQTVQIELNTSSLASFDTNLTRWVADAGTYRVKIGGSAEDMKLSKDFTLGSSIQLQKLNKVLVPEVAIKEIRP